MRINEFKLERFFATHEFRAPFLLCSSDCESFSVAELMAMEPGLEEMLLGLRLGYTESAGHPQLREEIAGLYSGVSAEDVLVFSGAEEGIFAFMNVFIQPGDHVVAQFPAYQSLLEVARSIGCEVTKWTLAEDRGWAPDLDLLKDSLRPNTRLIVINFPHNPTGAMITLEGFRSIADMAAERGIFLFSDEVYRFSEYDPADRLPGMCDVYEHGFSLGVMSKSFGLAGLRIGWIVTKKREALARLAAFKDYTTICNSAPSEVLAIAGLRRKEKIIARTAEIIGGNLKLLDEFFNRNAELLSWARPKAGPVGFPRLNSETDSESFCRDLREKAGVLLLPSVLFDFGSRHFRLGFGRKSMPWALERLDDYLAESGP